MILIKIFDDFSRSFLAFAACLVLFGTLYDYCVYQELIKHLPTVVHLVQPEENNTETVNKKNFLVSSSYMLQIFLLFVAY